MSESSTSPDEIASQTNVAWQRQLDALLSGECSEDEFMERLANFPDSIANSPWDVVALLDQRALSVPFGGMSITARPDLIVFRRSAPPRVIDWKAHAHMQTAARSQLALYAIALTNANPHQDFPSDPRIELAVNKEPTSWRSATGARLRMPS